MARFLQVAFRYDIGSLRPPRRLPSGQIVCDGYLTRTGVFVYRNSDGSERREYRPPEEVFNADSLASFDRVCVTDDHPPEAVTARNAKKYAVGNVEADTVRRDRDLVAATLLINDADTIEKIESGKLELSCGYEVELELRPGIAPDGERYDCIQRNIRGNHVAIVSVGRAGPAARLRIDEGLSDVAFQVRSDAGKQKGLLPMEELQKELAAAMKSALEANARADKAEKERDEQKARADKFEGEIAELTNEVATQKKRADDEAKARADSDAAAPARARARFELESSVKPLVGEGYDFDSKSDRELKVDAYEKISGKRIDDDKSDGFVDGVFATAMELRADADKSHDNVRKATETKTNADSLEDARQAMIKANREAGLAPLEGSN